MKTKRLIASILCLSLIFNSFTVAFADDFNEPKKASISNALFTEASTSETNSDEEGYASSFEEMKEAKDDDIASDSEASFVEDEVIASESDLDEVIASESEFDEDITASDSEATLVEDEIISTESELTIIVASESETLTIVSSKSEITSNENIFADINLATASNLTLASDSNIATNSSIGEDANRRFGYIPVNFVAPKATRDFDDDLFGAPNLPSQYDARTVHNDYGLSIVPPVRNQGDYGTCWAHSTVGMMETSIRTKNLVKTEEESNLSEAALAYFAFNLQNVTNSNNIDRPGIEGNDYTKINESYYAAWDDIRNANFADAGGNQFEGSILASAYMGVPTENADTLYSNANIAKILNQGLDGKYAFNSNSFEVKDVEFLNKTDIDLIKSAIMRNGSVGINYCEHRRDDNCSFHNGEYYYLASSRRGANHAVMIVGWNDDVPKEYFRNAEYTYDIETVSKNGAWLIRNSWGPSNNRMNAGYFWMSYEDPSIDSTVYSIEAIKKDTYKYNYHYDTTTNPDSIALNYQIANVYQVSNDEDQILQAMNISLENSNIDFDIDVYVKNSKMNTPIDGTKIFTRNYKNNIAGIWTIELNTNRLLKKGSYFSIVVKPKRLITINIDMIDNENMNVSGNPRAFYNRSEYGQGFTSENGRNWNDLNAHLMKTFNGQQYGANFRIRALTNPPKKIKFHANGGTGSMEDQVALANTNVKLNPNKFEREKYGFSHWSDNNANTYNDEATITLTDDLDLYANWLPGHTITFLGDGGVYDEGKTSYTQVVINDRDAVLISNRFTKSGYTFAGWTNGESIFSDNENIGKITTDISLTATWNKNRSGGGPGGGGGGGGGGRSALQNGTPLASTQTKLATSFASVPVSQSTKENTTWTTGTNGKWQLTIITPTGQIEAVKNSWASIVSQINVNGQMLPVDDRYYFDETGSMVTGWLEDAAMTKYYLDPSATAEQGKMVRGWKQIDGSWYYFNPTGTLLTNSTTPDGALVGADGKWMQ